MSNQSKTNDNIELEFVVNLLREMHEKDLPAYDDFTGEEGAKEMLGVLHGRIIDHIIAKPCTTWDTALIPKRIPVIVTNLSDTGKHCDTYFVIKKDDGALYLCDIEGVCDLPAQDFTEDDFDMWAYVPSVFWFNIKDLAKI